MIRMLGLSADAFRSAFCDRQRNIYPDRNLKREMLPIAAPADSMPKVRQYIRFTQQPWVGTCSFSFKEPVEYMPQHGLEYGRVVSTSVILLCTDLKPQQKELLLIDLVQGFR